VLITLPEGTRAFGVDLMTTSLFFSPDVGQSAFEVVLSDGTVVPYVSSYAPPMRGFVGFISSNPIASVYLNAYSSFPMIDNFSLPYADESGPAPPSAVPEPPTSLAMLASLIAIVVKRRRTNGNFLYSEVTSRS